MPHQIRVMVLQGKFWQILFDILDTNLLVAKSIDFSKIWVSEMNVHLAWSDVAN